MESTHGTVLRSPSHDDVALRRAFAALDASPNGIFTIDDDGVILDGNHAMEVLLGTPMAGIIGTPFLAFIANNPVARDAARLAAEGVRSSPEFVRAGVHALTRADGSTVYVDVSSQRISDDPREYTIFLVDVTAIEVERDRQRAAAERYRAIAQHSAHALILCATDPADSVIISGETVLGYPELTPLPGGFLSLTHPDDEAQVLAMMEAVRARDLHATETAELRLRAADGTWRTCDVTAENLVEDQAVCGVVLWAVDVTVRRAQEQRVETSMNWLRLLTENLAAAVLLEDVRRHVLVTNDEFVQMFGIDASPEDLVGEDCSNATGIVAHMFADPQGFIDGVETCLRNGVAVIGERLLLADGGTFERDYVPISTADGPGGHLWRYRDITQQLRETQLLADQNRSLEELARLKNEFVARVSHELRSPLTSVVSFADLLGDANAGELTEEQGEFLEIIVRNAQRLLRLIDDLLLVAKLESNTLPMSMGLLDLPTLITQSTEELGLRAQAKDISLHTSTAPGPRVRGDALRLQQVFTNLIGNAIGYTAPGGSVRVELAPKPDAGRWVLSVTDTGVGIPSSDIPQLFVPFFRSETGAQSRTPGTGLGLVIVKHIVDAHGGDIVFRSTVGVGTTVTVTLPFEVL